MATGVGYLSYYQWAKYPRQKQNSKIYTNINNKQIMLLTKLRYGPYPVTVADGVLNIDMIKISGDPWLSSIELWSVPSSNPTPSPTPSPIPQPTPQPTATPSGMDERERERRDKI